MNYIIVDDEPQARKLLQTYMAALFNYKLVKVCANAMEAYEVLHTSKIDLMLLDIKMPVISGTDFLRSLKNPPMVIFTTAYNKYAVEGYELNVVDYLLKPVALPRLLQALEKTEARLQANTVMVSSNVTGLIFIKTENKLVKVNLTDILLIEGMQNYLKIHLKEKVMVTPCTMKAMEGMLPAGQFLRVHRSFIVPLATVIAINGNIIETIYKKIPIGVSFKEPVMRHLNKK